MTLPTDQEFIAAYGKAPTYVQQFIDGEELTAVFKELRATYKLHLDDAATLANLMNAVLLGLIPLGSFEAALAEHMPNLDQASRTKVTREVNEKVFAAVRQHAKAPQQVVSAPASKPETIPVVPLPRPEEIVAAPTPSIVTQKLVGPTVETPKTITVPMPSLTNKPADNPRYSGGGDPYREPVE